MSPNPLEGPHFGAGDPIAISLPVAYRCVLTDSIEELARVRAWTRSVLAEQENDTCTTDALLVVDALVTDALMCWSAPHEIRLKIVNAGTRLLIEVNSSYQPPPVRSNLLWSGATSRLLLEQLTVDWGVRRQDGAKTTWATVKLTAAA